MKDLIERQAAINAAIDAADDWDGGYSLSRQADMIERAINNLPSAQPEQLTDAEQRIFLKAIEREEKVCKKVDEEWGSGDEECEINLVHACHEIIRKVKGASADRRRLMQYFLFVRIVILVIAGHAV